MLALGVPWHGAPPWDLSIGTDEAKARAESVDAWNGARE